MTQIHIPRGFLDEVRILLDRKAGAIAMLSFPVGRHWGAVGDDGSVMVYTKMPTAVSLLAEGVLPPLGGAAVELMVGGRKLDAMLLTEVRCEPNGGHHDIAVLVFVPAPDAAEP